MVAEVTIRTITTIMTTKEVRQTKSAVNVAAQECVSHVTVKAAHGKRPVTILAHSIEAGFRAHHATAAKNASCADNGRLFTDIVGR